MRTAEKKWHTTGDERSPFGRLNGKAFSWTMKTCSISVSVLGAEFCWRVNRRRRSTAGIVRRKASQSEDLCRLNNSSPRPGVLGRGESIAGAFAQFRIVCALVCALVRTRLCMRVYARACSPVSVSIFQSSRIAAEKWIVRQRCVCACRCSRGELNPQTIKKGHPP